MATPSGNAALGVRLHELRKEKGLKLAALANESEVALAYVSEVERGRKLPSLEVLDRLAGALGLSVLGVLGGIEPYAQVNVRQRQTRGSITTGKFSLGDQFAGVSVRYGGPT